MESLRRETVDLKRRLSIRQLIFKGPYLNNYPPERSPIGVIIDVVKKKFGLDVQIEDIVWNQRIGRTALVAEFSDR